MCEKIVSPVHVTDGELLHLLIENVQDYAIFVTDPEGRVRNWNLGAERLLGYSESEIIGQSVSRFFTPEDCQSGVPEREKANAVETRREEFERWHVRKNGSRFWSGGTITPLWDCQQRLLGFAMIMQVRTGQKHNADVLRDMTEQKRMQEAFGQAPAEMETQVREQTAALRTANDDLRAASIAQEAQVELLRKGQEQFGELAEHIHQCLWTFDVVEDRLLYVSPGYEKVWGSSCQICLNDASAFMKLIHSLNQEMLTLGGDTDQTGCIDVERCVVRPDGEERRVWIRGYPVTKDGRTVRLVGIVEDITEKWQLIRERDALLTRLQIHIERVPLAYVQFGPDMRFLAWNPAAERMFGFTEAEVLGKHPFEVFIPTHLQEVAEKDLARLRCGDMEAHGEYQNLTKDGRTITCEWFSTPLMGEQGEFLGFVSLGQDVTASREREKQLQLRDRAIQAVSQGILITDASQSGNPIIYASPGFERMTGYRAEEVLGRNCRFLQGKDTAPETLAVLRQAIHEGRECSVEILNYRKDGTEFWNALFVTPVLDDDQRLAYFVGVQVDVTDRRALELAFHQSQKMEAVGQLAGGVAHDFNNLLTIILGYSEILLSNLDANDPLRDSVKVITEAGQLAASLTRQLLAFSRKAVLETKVLDLNEVVHDTEKLLRRIIGEDIELTAVLDPQISRVKVDPSQLDQVLMNLSVNARDAMPGGGKLKLETKNVEFKENFSHGHATVNAGSYVMLAVSDSGSGMVREVKSHIFEPFFTTKAIGVGTGLGLAVVHGIVTQSGGHIEVFSEVNHGTTFQLYFPAIEEQVAVAMPVVATSDVRGEETVLLVEDEDSVRGLAQIVLKSRGYKVLTAGDGLEALNTIDQHCGAIDLLLTDVVMPGMGGVELAETLRPRFPDMRVLFSSGYTDDSVLRNGILEEGVAFLQKPYTAHSLTAKVRQLLDNQ